MMTIVWGNSCANQGKEMLCHVTTNNIWFLKCCFQKPLIQQVFWMLSEEIT